MAGRLGENLAHPFVLSLNASHSRLLYEWNRLEEAEACVRRLLGRGDTPPVARTLLHLYGSASRIMQARGYPAQAADLLLQLRARVDSPDYDLYIRRIEAEEACLRVRQGDLRRAAAWLGRCGMSHADEVSVGSVTEQLALARVLAACGRGEEALDLAERLYALLCREDRLRDRIQALLVQCAALRGLGRTDEAVARLDTALRLAEPQGFVRSFVDEGEVMAELLAAYAGSEARGAVGAFAYARRLLQALSADGAGRTVARGNAETGDGEVSETADRGAAEGDVTAESKAPAVGRLQVNCFGRFKVCGPDGREVRWRTSKAEELLAYLVHHRGEAADRYRIMDALWDDDSAKTSANLHTTVHLLRKTLASIGIEGVIQHNRGFYRVDVDVLDCDYLSFEAWASAGTPPTDDNIDRCEAISKLYAGPYLSDNGYPWSDPVGKSLENEFLALLLQIYDYYMGDGNYPAAIAVMKRALKHAAWREDVHVRLIQAYLACKDRIAALKQYDALKRMLRTEYRLEPGG
ncbi:winged helix-turn-helix domain-containing protein [Cohnella ginsengisoli]|uniref:Winged helix-turn-helix domain-containing protein n=1 Tax=Cohnella ginsengisoli TaxID=425004 RepID=A0A9X4KLI7_9BACL|nr:BTAD domain-containing putative transcriptional regulator [Cohnella ginsengisoli]MDG0794096.1 winged helix-turn-helix domain-containing protein [Cohnella ginsengisoli]